MADYRDTGVFNIDGQWATSIRYQALVKDARVSEIDLTFMNGRSRVGTYRGEREQALALLGEHNLAAIESGAGEHDQSLKGQLRGARLHYRAVTLAKPAAQPESQSATDVPENAIERGSLERGIDGGEQSRLGATASIPAFATPASGEAATDPRASQRQNPYPIPAELERRFIRVEHRFYFPDRSLAFVDRGTRLSAETENIEVIRSLIEIAQTRGWEAIRVTGTDTFRRQVWHEAARRGMAVRGYVPSDVERAQLARERAERSEAAPAPQPDGGAVEQAPLRPDGHSPAADPSALGSNTGPPRRGDDIQAATGAGSTAPSDVIFGTLIETGEAPFRFQAHADPSPYLRIATDKGERVLWGIDFPRALAQAQTQPQPGDAVGVQYLGQRAVTLKVPVKDRDGSVKSYEQISTHRNTWAVEKPAYFEARAARVEALRNPATAREALLASHPELAAAITWLHLAEQLAAKSIADPHDQERFVSMVREGLAQAIARSQPLAPPKLRVVALRQPERGIDRTPPERAAPSAQNAMAR